MAKLNNCPHCGAETEFITNKQGAVETVLARCTNCKIQTQGVASSLEYSAMAKVAAIWNASDADGWPEWIPPKGARCVL
jgi:transcription elongation factor Elf1